MLNGSPLVPLETRSGDTGKYVIIIEFEYDVNETWPFSKYIIQ